MKSEYALEGIRLEYISATDKFGRFLSPHEGLAIILEEYEELKTEVFKQFPERDIEKLRKEAKHLSAMAMRFMVDIT